MKVKFWGTRGSIAAPGKDTTIYGGNTTCLEFILNGEDRVIVDAGTGIRVLGEELRKQGKNVVAYLFLTHIHWDHILGFPFFAPIYDPSTELFVDGYPSCMKGLRYAFDNNLGDGFFPVQFSDLKAKITHFDHLKDGPLRLKDTTIDKISLYHPQGAFGYRFNEGDKTIVFMTDNELTKEISAPRRLDDYVAFCQDADVLIHDAQYLPDEMESRRGWGHSDFVSACELAMKAKVKKLILFHHDPARKDPDVLAIKLLCEDLVEKNHAELIIDAAKEGSEIDL
jgi:phosphoribosyl 1,2-cyclic phosphodiesterase